MRIFGCFVSKQKVILKKQTKLVLYGSNTIILDPENIMHYR